MSDEKTKEHAHSSGSDTLTPQLVRQVAEWVYVLWLQALEIERERRPPDAAGTIRHGGGQ